MAVKMFDLAGADENRRFSPFCWRTRMALAHKGLEVESIPWRFTEKDRLAMSGQGLVPVLQDGDKVISDSWAIANYLDQQYPKNPLFGHEAAKGAALLIKFWCEKTLHPFVSHMVILDLFAAIHEKDKVYFRQSREKRFGMTLEEWGANREATRIKFHEALEPLRAMLAEQPWIAGPAPAYADYIVFGLFQWMRCISPFKVLEESDPVYAWRDRTLKLFDGMAAKAVGYPV